jgi:predicted PurR-regulated permease PerM
MAPDARHRSDLYLCWTMVAPFVSALVLGGLTAFDPPGLILGPLIITVAMVLAETWRARPTLQTAQEIVKTG